ncbi:flagellar filament capping protein FliD [Fuchsiella alkaliacetigena]|uniref:flagellar filament capping protein FliD n=1 Tax=Fuchsiella alkaliacetigena TaxID=957042 RepID=UPI00200AC61D|nr:flagellar filament capping protein FliD [Fuchsiella alkaliacetigena]MCK8825073.1 hypothetical protein [Fuchsiella alkaliacetigena]
MVQGIGSTGNPSPLFNQNISQQQLLQQITQANISNRLANMSFEAPQQQRGLSISDSLDFARDFRTTFGELRDTAAELTIPSADTALEDSVFAARTAEVSDPEIAEATVDTEAVRGEFTLEVEELATAQEELSTAIEAEETAGEFLGIEEEEEFTFSIEQDGIEEEFTVNLDADTEMQAALEQITEEIEAAELDITAEVIEVEDDQVQLQLSAAEVGTAQEFTIEDIEGELIEELNLETIQEAQDTQVEISDFSEEEIEVQGDQILIDDERIEIEALDIGTTDIEVESDIEAIQTGIEEFAGAFNEALELTQDQRVNGDLDQLRSRLMGPAQFSSSRLRDIGIEVDREEGLSIDQDRLTSSLEEDIETVEREIGGRIGLAAQTELRAEEALRTPPSQFMEARAEQEELDSLFELANFNIYNQAGRFTSPFGFAQQGLLIDFFL